MALTIAVCVGGFAVIYAKIDPYARDFVNAATVTPTKAPTKTPKAGKSADSGSSGQTAANTDAPTNTPVPARPTSTPRPTETPTGFNPDYTISAASRVNFRSGPSVDSDVVDTLSPGTQLQYLNDTQASADPAADGASEWMKFQDQNGDQGWIRSVDVEKIS